MNARLLRVEDLERSRTDLLLGVGQRQRLARIEIGQQTQTHAVAIVAER